MTERTWANQAACKGKPAAWWFCPDSSNKPDWERDERPKGRLICAGCPVREVCLEENLHEPYGVWGGFDAGERSDIARGRSDARLRVEVCARAECGSSFATVNNGQLYCSTVCQHGEAKSKQQAKREYERAWRARQKAEAKGEMFDPHTMKPHTYIDWGTP